MRICHRATDCSIRNEHRIKLPRCLPAISGADLIAKLGHVEEEADETLYWMELLIERQIVTAQKLQPLMSDVVEVLAMTVASIQTIRVAKIQNPKSKI